MTTAVTVTQLRNLTDRAASGLTPDEQQRLREGIDALHAERVDARQKFATVAAQRDRLRTRMNALADRWEHALGVDKPYARTLRAEISIEPFGTDDTPSQLARAEAATDGELRRQLADAIRALGKAETELADIRALRDQWVKAGPPPLGTSISRWWDKRLAELGAALDARPANDTTRHVHVTITNPDAYTANRAALSLVDWINAEFPGHHVTTDAREWEQPGPD